MLHNCDTVTNSYAVARLENPLLSAAVLALLISKSSPAESNPDSLRQSGILPQSCATKMSIGPSKVTPDDGQPRECGMPRPSFD